MTTPLPGIVHMRVRNKRQRFRVYAVHLGYLINECSEQQLRRYLLDEGTKELKRAIDAAIANAKNKGTSLVSANGFVLDGPWLNEERVQRTQHAFVAMAGGERCSYCGDIESATHHTRLK